MTGLEIEIFTKLRIPDRVALTAFATVKRMEAGTAINALNREDYFTLQIDETDETEALKYVKSMVDNTAVFANPNKHIAEIAVKRLPRSSGDKFVVLTYEGDSANDEVLTQKIRELGYSKIVSAGRGVVWTLDAKPGTQLQAVEDIIVTRSRTDGLLLNPHSGSYEFI